ALGRRALPLVADVTQDGDMEAVASAIRDEFGRLDLVLANAGFGVTGHLEELTLDDFRRQFETNVFGVLRTIYATLDDLKQSRGSLGIVGSVAGWIARPGGAPYSMSKFAVRALAQSLRDELAPAGVGVTLISPGFVASEIRRVRNDGQFVPGEDPVPSWLKMPVETAARQIVNALRRRPAEAVITGHGKAIVFFERHSPWLLRGMARGLSGFSTGLGWGSKKNRG
ncbi:MAG: SDR family NAD(P)-dependent oxidoreductase, partial [Planctomycetes bacterium]|nr:SDR family NAD(P)-dependent oxidoreductase [Planctomycetota bacterium]